MTDIAATPEQVLRFWQDAGPRRWFKRDPDFDADFHARFLATHEAAAAGALDSWLASADGALALVLLLDQFPRNAFRGTPRVYATDAKARASADLAIRAGFDRMVPEDLRQ
ncbi:MAG TPA: DUF924 family protein, partial [Ramlibacter sp.]|uniref:DUF924 family protein n=1 Tax=Ramlibacter sp. TaxID=1917967 RepID=UPI002D805D46